MRCGTTVDSVANRDRDLAGQKIDHGGRAAAIGHMHDVDAGLQLEELAGEMVGGAVARAAERQLAGILLGVGDELRDVVDRHGFVDDQRDRKLGRLGQCGEILHRIVVQLLDQERRDAVGGGGAEKQGVAVGRRTRHEVGGERAAGALPALHDHRLLEALRQLFGDRAGDEIGGGAGSERRDDPDRMGRPVVGAGRR